MSATDMLFYVPMIVVLAALWLPISLDRIPAKYLGMGCLVVAFGMWHFEIHSWAVSAYAIAGVAFCAYAIFKHFKRGI